MKTKIEWRHGSRILKLDDTDYDVFPEDGDIIELDEDGDTFRFEVKGTEKATVILELAEDQTAPVTEHGEPAEHRHTIPKDELTPDQRQARLRKAERLAAEQSAEKQRARKFKVTPKKKR